MPKFPRHKVLVDLTRLRRPYNGLGQFCLRLGKAMEELNNEDLQTTFLIPKDQNINFRDWPHIEWQNPIYRKASPLLLKKAYSLVSQQYDVWHVTDQDSQFWPLDDKTPVVFTIHDLNFLRDGKSQIKINRRLRNLQKKVDRASVITTVSHFSKGDIERHLDLKGKPLQVIYNGGIDIQTKSTPLECDFKKRKGINKPFLLFIGEITRKKNALSLLPMMKLLPDYQLVMAGKNETDYAEKIRKEIRRHDLKDRVKLPGIITDQERDWCYQHCEGVVFPSLAEGFGLPVIEAMQYQKPVFVSTCASLPEIAGEQGFYWDSFDPRYMADVVRSGLERAGNNDTFSKSLSQRASVFSWQAAAQQYFEVYKGILEPANPANKVCPQTRRRQNSEAASEVV